MPIHYSFPCDPLLESCSVYQSYVQVTTGYRDSLSTFNKAEYVIKPEDDFKWPEDVNSALTCFFMGCFMRGGQEKLHERLHQLDNSSCYIGKEGCVVLQRMFI